MGTGRSEERTLDVETGIVDHEGLGGPWSCPVALCRTSLRKLFSKEQPPSRAAGQGLRPFSSSLFSKV